MKIKIYIYFIVISLFFISCISQPLNNDNTNQMANARDDRMEILYSHFRYVISPTVRGNSLVLNNDYNTLIYKPNNFFELINTQTEVSIMGIYEFTIFSQPRIPNEHFGKVFLFNFDDILDMTRSQLFSSNFEEIAHTILIPIKSTATEVIYIYEKPYELSGTEIEFRIMGILEN